ncbi:MAG: hypothetical protein GXP25_00690 [Planctomycetes bacterium]|nr:hypothetical protein [Planctomycetota bacterium]
MRLTQLMLTTALMTTILAGSAWADTVIKENFEEQGKWQKSIRGKGTVELVEGGVEGKCLKVSTSKNALVYYSIPLDVERVRGKRLIVRAKVKLDNVTQGEKSYATAKLHIGTKAGKQHKNYAQRFIGTRDWHDQILIAEIAQDVDRVVLDLGIQNGNGTAWFDNLVVDDGVKEHEIISIASVANTNHRQVGLDDIPIADLRLAGADFYVLPINARFGRTCAVLRGKDRPDLPARIETVIPVDKKGSRLFFLQAAMGCDAARQDPCLIYTIHYEDGKSVEAPMREGVDIGSLEDPKDLPNWKVAWTSKRDGKTIGLGVTTWNNPHPDVPIKFIRLSTPGTGAVPIVVAISLDPKRK